MIDKLRSYKIWVARSKTQKPLEYIFAPLKAMKYMALNKNFYENERNQKAVNARIITEVNNLTQGSRPGESAARTGLEFVKKPIMVQIVDSPTVATLKQKLDFKSERSNSNQKDEKVNENKNKYMMKRTRN